MIDWLLFVFVVWEKGLLIVNIVQLFKFLGLMLICWKDIGIIGLVDFVGKMIGVWFFGNEYLFLFWMSQEGILIDGGEDGIIVLKQGFNVDLLLQCQVDCILMMIYNEYYQVLLVGVSEDEFVIFKYEDVGVVMLEDGLYVFEENFVDFVFVDCMVKFVVVFMEGWKWVEVNLEEVVMIVLDYDEIGV